MQDKDINENLQKIADLKAILLFGERYLPFLEALLIFARETSPLLEELSTSLREGSGDMPGTAAGPEAAGSLLSRLDEIDGLFREAAGRLQAEREVIGAITEGIEKLLKLPEARKKLSVVFEDRQAREIGVKIKAAVDSFLGEKAAAAVAEKAGRLLQEARAEAAGLQSVFQEQGFGKTENARALLSLVRERLDNLFDKYPGAGLPDFIADSSAGSAGRMSEEALETTTAADSPQAMPEQLPVMLQSEAEMPESKAFEEEITEEAAVLPGGEIPEEIPEEMPEDIGAGGGVETSQDELNQLLDWGSDLDKSEVAAEPQAEEPVETESAEGDEAPTLDEQLDAEAETAEQEAGKVVGEVEQSIEELLGETAVVEEEPAEETVEAPEEAAVEAGEVIGEVEVSVEELFEEKPVAEEQPAGEARQAAEEAAESTEDMTEEDRKSAEALFEDTAEAGEASAEETAAAGDTEVEVSVDDLFADSPAGEEPPAVEAMQTGEEAAEKIEEMTEEDRKATEALFEDTAEAGEAMAAPPEAAVKETPAEETGPEPAGESVEDTKPAVKDKKARAVKAPAAEPGDMETEAELSISQEEIDKLFQ